MFLEVSGPDYCRKCAPGATLRRAPLRRTRGQAVGKAAGISVA